MSTARYSRQMILPEVGATGQDRLAAAHVVVIGAGGLGSTVLPALAGAGVGQITILDHDRVEVSNLHRQPLYRQSDIGAFKAEAAAATLRAYNPDIAITARTEALTPANAGALVAEADLIVDAADSFAVTYALSDQAFKVGKVLVSASVLGFSGYVGAFCGEAPSYRAVFPHPPDQAASCATAGVIGPAVATLGALQAQITLAMILGLDPSPLGRLITFDLKTLRSSSFSFLSAAEPPGPVTPFIAPEEVTADDLVIDLRGIVEAPVLPFPLALRVLPEAIAGWRRPPGDDRRIVLCCRTGLRAWRAAEELKHQGAGSLAVVALGLR